MDSTPKMEGYQMVNLSNLPTGKINYQMTNTMSNDHGHSSNRTKEI
jgi:hypothetical protein